MSFDKYASEHFDDLWLLSKDAMQERSIDKVAERYGKKAKKEPVTVSLFKDLTDWRRRLFNEIRLQATTLWSQDNRMVDNAVQKFFDRLIFIRTVEDRGIEQARLRPILRQYANKGAIFPQLQALFTELDSVYNSNLFAQHELDMLEVHDPILIGEIIDGLYKQAGNLVEYNFNAITADILGTVYEQYLSFKAVDPQAKQDTTKSKKRKSQGIYYTPQYVVRYIVQNTLGTLLESGIDPHSLTILDPACGSGSFLIEAFDVLDRWLAQAEPDVSPQERRERILKENIFGVDLDEQAIEVTRLNLMLRASFSRRKLPYLTNIKHGNSLIEPLSPTLSPSNGERGQNDEASFPSTNDFTFDWEERFPDVFARGGFDVVIGNPPYVRQETLGAGFKTYAKTLYDTYAGTADLYVYFVERGYKLLRDRGRMGYILPNKWLRANYGKALRGFLRDKADTLIDFGDLPVFADATTYPLILTLNKQPLSPSKEDRQKTTVTDVIHVTQATELPDNTTLASILPPLYEVPRTALDKKGWSLARPQEQALLNKLNACGVPLGEYVDNKIYRGILTGLNEAFVIDNSTRKSLIQQDPKSEDLIKPFLAGRDVKRYQQSQSDKFLISIPNGWTDEQADAPNKWQWLQSEYPAIANHLAPFEVKAIKRSDQGVYWWELRPCAYYEEFDKSKIVYSEIATRGHFTLDVDHQYYDTTAYILGSDSKYLLGIFNSALWTFVFSHISSQIRGGFLRWKRQYMSPLPIRKLDLSKPTEKAQHDDLVALVEKMLSLKADYTELDNTLNDRRHEVRESIERTDKAIDKAVYALYGLSEDEIKIVEG